VAQVEAMHPRQVLAGFLNTDWSPRSLPAGTTTENVVLRTSDGAATSGALYAAGRPRTAVCIMHPREFMACHYLVPDIVAAGFAAWCQAPRSVGNDLRLEHEVALHDVAAGLAFLRERGCERIVLLGNSGGSGLYALYAQQAALAPAERIARTPGGRPTKLADADLTPIDAMVLVAPHPGQGALLMNAIDPSVVDEGDALSVDPALDPLGAANGFAAPPRSARYAAAFVARYREAQRARVARIDERARAAIAARMDLRRRGSEALADDERRRAAHTPIMLVWRTDADLRCFDQTLDPSDRGYGSVWGRDPFASNYGAVGFARWCTPESWLSTWSGLSSNALLAKTGPAIRVPTLMVEYTGDVTCFPEDFRAMFASLGATDKTHLRIRGDHHGRALAEGEEPGRYAAGRAIATWLAERFAE
jgi:pimeloyl-ACP methyl ester carboxylesterase